MSKSPSQTLCRLLGLTLALGMAGIASVAQAEQVLARVVSATPVPESTGNVQYNVTYEYAGRQYTTRTDTRPGTSIPIEVGSYGVATTQPVMPPAQLQSRPVDSGPPQDWNNVQAEPGVVVSSAPAPVYSRPVPVYSAPPVYATPAPVYYGAPAPVYVPPAYAYPAPYYYPPIGLSLNLGYSRGWGGHGRWR